MSLDLKTYKERLGSYKVSGNEGIIDSMKKQILDNFYINPSYEQVTINFENRDVHIVQEGVRGLRLLTKPDEDIKSGEYILWKDEEYLCTHRFPDDKVQTKGTIQFCNHHLKWIDKVTGELVIRPCIEDARTLYTTGIKDEKVMEIPNGMVGIMLPFGDVTRKLDRNDRFVLNKTSYRVTFYDETNYEGLITLICQETGLSHLDDKENEIANRWVEINSEKVDRLPWLDDQNPPIEPEEPEESEVGISYTIEITERSWTDTDYKLPSGSWQRYKISKSEDGILVPCEFTFKLSEKLNQVDLVIESDDTCRISVGNIFGKYSVNLEVTDVETGEVVLIQEIYIDGR